MFDHCVKADFEKDVMHITLQKYSHFFDLFMFFFGLIHMEQFILNLMWQPSTKWV